MLNNNEAFDLAKEYEIFAQQGKDSMRASGVIHDSEMYPPQKDHRRGLGLFFFQEGIKERSYRVLQTIQDAFPDEIIVYGLPDSPATQHVTFLELLGVVPEQEYKNTIVPLIPAYHEVVLRVLDRMKPIKAHFTGIAVNQTTIIMKGFPESQYYNSLRDQLRGEIQKAGLPELKRRKVQIFHTTIARFIRPITDIEKLLSIVDQYKQYDFGEDMYDTLFMSSASWLMAENQIQRLHRYDLGGKEIGTFK